MQAHQTTPQMPASAIGDAPVASDAPLLSAPPPPGAGTSRPARKKHKLRAAWISFAGRIVAQAIGGAATVLLSVIFVQSYVTSPPPAAVETATTATAAAPVVRPPGQPVLAVLPFLDFSDGGRLGYFADGMTETVIAELADSDRLRVVSRTSSMHYKAERRRLPDIARELGADLIVEGSVMSAGDRVRVTVQLIDARTDTHLWAHTSEGAAASLIALHDEVSGAVAWMVRAHVGPAGAQARRE